MRCIRVFFCCGNRELLGRGFTRGFTRGFHASAQSSQPDSRSGQWSQGWRRVWNGTETLRSNEIPFRDARNSRYTPACRSMSHHMMKKLAKRGSMTDEGRTRCRIPRWDATVPRPRGAASFPVPSTARPPFSSQSMRAWRIALSRGSCRRGRIAPRNRRGPA